MAAYLAHGIEEDRLDYKAVLSKPLYSKLKPDIDAILVADGKQEKIVPLN